MSAYIHICRQEPVTCIMLLYLSRLLPYLEYEIEQPRTTVPVAGSSVVQAATGTGVPDYYGPQAVAVLYCHVTSIADIILTFVCANVPHNRIQYTQCTSTIYTVQYTY